MRIVRYIACASTLSLLLTAAVNGSTASTQEGQQLRRLSELRRDIAVLNLLNGLHLTEKQESALLQDARNAQNIAESYKRQFDQLFPDAEKSLEDLKSQLLQGETAPGNPIDVRAIRAKNEITRLHRSYIHDLAIVEKHVSATLTDGQKQIIADFIPCLIPPKDMKNPARAGQAGDSGNIERMLRKARTVPDEVYARRFDIIFDRLAAKYEEEFGPVTEEVRKAEKERIRSVFEEARAMSDVDFELNKQDLAKRLDRRVQQGRTENISLVGHGERRGKISRFLLDERIIPLLEQRRTAAGTVNPQLSKGTD